MSSSIKEDEAKSQETKKFFFDAHDFSPEAIAREQRKKAEFEKAHRFTEQDVEKAQKDGLEKGKKAALEDIQNQLNQTTQKLDAAMQSLLTKDQEMQSIAIHTSLIIVRKLLPALFRQKSMEEIERVISEAVHERPEEPRIVIRIHPEMLQPLRERIEEISAAQGYNGKIMLLADENINVRSDCKIEWADGGAERFMGVLFSKIEANLLHDAGPVPEHLTRAPKSGSDVAQRPTVSENSSSEAAVDDTMASDAPSRD